MTRQAFYMFVRLMILFALLIFLIIVGYAVGTAMK